MSETGTSSGSEATITITGLFIEEADNSTQPIIVCDDIKVEGTLKSRSQELQIVSDNSIIISPNSTIQTGYHFKITSCNQQINGRTTNNYEHNLIPNFTYGIYSKPKTSPFDRKMGSIFLYPNPTDNEIRLTFSEEINPHNGFVKIYDQFGRVVLHYYIDSSINSFDINLSSVHPGKYYLEFRGRNYFATKKIIINK